MVYLRSRGAGSIADFYIELGLAPRPTDFGIDDWLQMQHEREEGQ